MITSYAEIRSVATKSNVCESISYKSLTFPEAIRGSDPFKSDFTYAILLVAISYNAELAVLIISVNGMIVSQGVGVRMENLVQIEQTLQTQIWPWRVSNAVATRRSR